LRACFFVRYESENNIRQLIATNDQLNKDFRKANEDKQSQISSMDQIRPEKREMQQRLGEVEELLRTTEAARKTAERRLTDCQKVHNISFKDVKLSDMELGKGSYGGDFW
jgi:chromosome segregation ATPase